MEPGTRKVYQNVDDYIAAQAYPVREKLEELRRAIRKAAPEALECISYQMPAYKFKGILAWFAAFKNHYALLVRPEIKMKFIDQLAPYKQTKSSIHFLYNEAVPVVLVNDIITYAVQRTSQNRTING